MMRKVKFWMPILLCIIMTFITGCGLKKCQQPATEKFKTITASEWRLVETTDPDPTFKKLNNTTFLIFKFERNFTGMVSNVINNDKSENPIKTFIYNVDSEGRLLRIQYQTIPAATESGSTTQVQTSNPIDYSYDLGRELEMTQYSNGAYYRFVPFQGVVDPDNQCTF